MIQDAADHMVQGVGQVPVAGGGERCRRIWHTGFRLGGARGLIVQGWFGRRFRGTVSPVGSHTQPRAESGKREGGQQAEPTAAAGNLAVPVQLHQAVGGIQKVASGKKLQDGVSAE